MSSWRGKMRQLGTWFFSLLQCALPIDALKLNTSCVSRRCSANRKKIRKLKFWNYWTACLLAFLSLFIIQKKIQNRDEQFAAFFLFVGTSPKDCTLLGRNGNNGNTLKLKTTAKLNCKHTSIATVQDLYRMFATLLTPLGSHYRLPLKSDWIVHLFF